MTQNIELNKIKVKIKSLLAKRPENGCSEHEAHAAMQMVDKLLQQYNLTMNEIDVREAVCKTIYLNTGRERRGAIDGCMIALADLFYAKVWVSSRWIKDEGNRLHYAFFGQEQDLEMIEYLFDVIQKAIETEVAAFQQTDDYKNSSRKKSATVSFGHGMASRLHARLRQMKRDNEEELRRAHEAQQEGVVDADQPQEAANAKRGTALVVLKNQLIEDEFKQAHTFKLRKSYSTRNARDYNAFNRGHAAGGNVNLSRPIGGGAKNGGYLA